MGLTQDIQNDILAITTNTNDFGIPLTFTAPTSPLAVVTVAGTAKRHHLQFDEMGMVKGNTLNATCSVSALALNAINYPYRDGNGMVTFKNHLVSWADVTNIPIQYVVNEWYPDDGNGLIVLILGEYGSD